MMTMIMIALPPTIPYQNNHTSSNDDMANDGNHLDDGDHHPHTILPL